MPGICLTLLSLCASASHVCTERHSEPLSPLPKILNPFFSKHKEWRGSSDMIAPLKSNLFSLYGQVSFSLYSLGSRWLQDQVSCVPWHPKSPACDLMLDCHHFKTPNSFQTKAPHSHGTVDSIKCHQCIWVFRLLLNYEFMVCVLTLKMHWCIWLYSLLGSAASLTGGAVSQWLCANCLSVRRRGHRHDRLQMGFMRVEPLFLFKLFFCI